MVRVGPFVFRKGGPSLSRPERAFVGARSLCKAFSRARGERGSRKARTASAARLRVIPARLAAPAAMQRAAGGYLGVTPRINGLLFGWQDDITRGARCEQDGVLVVAGRIAVAPDDRLALASGTWWVRHVGGMRSTTTISARY